MDAEHTWVASGDVDTLIDVILECKKTLTKHCFAKYGAAKVSEFEVCASKKVCTFLALSEKKKTGPIKEKSSVYTKHIGDFELFSLYEFRVIDDKNIRIVIRFDVGENIGKHLYGNIVLA